MAMLGAAAFALASPAAAAGPEACGGIELASISSCHFEFDGGCEAKCEPLRFTAACDGACNLDIDTVCTQDCGASCQTSCESDPGSFSCRAACTSDCNANVKASCGNDEGCISVGQASCSSECEGRCSVTAPSASCDTQCNACCGASCDVDASLDCRVDCSLDMRGGCEVDCRAPSGALFCDGQYIAVQDLPACVAYLADNLKLEVSVEATANGFVGCNVSQAPTGDDAGWAGLGLLAFGSVLRRLQRRGGKAKGKRQGTKKEDA
jgi:hypothetical protein